MVEDSCALSSPGSPAHASFRGYNRRMKKLKLKEGNDIPIIGFGTWLLKRDECRRSVETALEVGYRYIDTADVYGNHEEVAKAIKNSGLKREELFITSKVWRSELKKDLALYAGERFLDELDTPYLDLLLVHWPNKDVPISETMSAFAELKEKGITKSIGVSNFNIDHLEDVLKTDIEISVNQVEFHPSLNQENLRKYCDEKGIVLTAYSPNAQGEDFNLDEVIKLARKYSKTESQIILNWIINKNIVAIPRSSNPDHIKENFESVSWEMEDKDYKALDNLNSGNRLVNPSFNEFDH